MKYIAAIAMVFDHIGMFFIPVSNPVGCIFRIIGRLTAPIMCYFIAEGYRYTSSKPKYAQRLLIFALISQFAYAFSHSNSLLKPDFNVIYTLSICFIILCCYDRIANAILKWVLISVLFALSYFGDWGIFAPLWVLTFWIFRNNTAKKVISYCAVSALVVISDSVFLVIHGYHWCGELWQLGLYMFIPFIFLYNGQKGKSGAFSKWFFYIFYPVHLVILGIIKLYIG